MQPKAFLPALGVSLAGAVLLAACGGGGSGSSTGTLKLSLTDAPACGYDHVYVNVVAVKVHQNANADPVTGSGWQTITLTDPVTGAAAPRRIDLLGLTNGALETLGQTVLPAGTYSQLRLVLADTGNAVVRSGETAEVALTTPSGQTSGYKLNTHITVEPNQLADFALDFNACKSIVTAGNSGKLNLKPVVSVVPVISTAMAVDGYLSNVTPYTSVSLQLNGQVVRSTVPNPNTGFFALPYLSTVGAGYDLVISAPDRRTQVVTAVPVSASAITHISQSSNPIALQASASQSVSGSATVQASSAPVTDATVSARQTVATGKDVEIAARPVDGVTGGYRFTLATAALETAPFSTAGLVWTTYTDSTAKYTIRSEVPGLSPQNTAVDLSATDQVVNFTY